MEKVRFFFIYTEQPTENAFIYLRNSQHERRGRAQGKEDSHFVHNL